MWFWIIAVPAAAVILWTGRYPRFNNKVFLALVLATIALFGNALVNGKPLGYQALESLFPKPGPNPYVAERDRALETYRKAAGLPQPEPPTEATGKNHGGDFPHWTLFLLSFGVTLVYFPLAFSDEVKAAWQHAHQVHQEKPFRSAGKRDSAATGGGIHWTFLRQLAARIAGRRSK